MSDIARETLARYGFEQTFTRTHLGMDYLGYKAEPGVVIFVNDEAISTPGEEEIVHVVARIGRHLLEHGDFGPIDVGGVALLPYRPPTQIVTESHLYEPADPKLDIIVKRFNELGGDMEFFAMSRIGKSLHEHNQSAEPLQVTTPAQYALLLQSTGRQAGIGTIVMEQLHGEVLGVRIQEALNAGRDDEAEALMLIVAAVQEVLQHALTPGELALINDLTADDSGHNLEALGTYAGLFDPTTRLVLALLDQPHLSDQADRGTLLRIISQPKRPE